VNPFKTVITAFGGRLFPDILNYVPKKRAPEEQYFAGRERSIFLSFLPKPVLNRIFHTRGHHFHSSQK
jgi:hypothetical protein